MTIFHVSQEQRDIYWNHFIERWAVGGWNPGHSVTGAKLRKVKDVIMADDEFWHDVYSRHSGNQFHSPEDMEQQNQTLYDHCVGNFWGMIYQELVECGLVKTRGRR